MAKKAHWSKLAGVCTAITLGVSGASQWVTAGSVAGTGGSTEVTQLLNNAELGMQTIQDYARNLTMTKQLYIDTLQQMTGALDPSVVTNTMNQVSQITNTLGSVQRLYASTSTLKDTLQWRMNQFSASGLDWRSYVQREKDRAQFMTQRSTMLSEQEQVVMEQVNKNYETVRVMQSKIDQTAGVHESQQLMNGQMSTLLTMVNQANANAAVREVAKQQKEGIDEAEKQLRRKEGEESINAHNQAIDSTSQFSRALGTGRFPSPFAPAQR